MGKICCSLCRNLFFPVLILFKHNKTQYESHPIFPFSDGFHKLELCIGLNPFFFIFVLLFRFGVLRYVFLGPYLRFLSLWGNSLCSRWSVLSFCFFLPFSFVDFTISVFFLFVNSLFWFFLYFYFLFCLLLCNYFYFQTIIFKNPCIHRSKTNPAGIFHKASLLFNQQGFSCHFFWLLHSHQLDQGRCDVCQAAALS